VTIERHDHVVVASIDGARWDASISHDLIDAAEEMVEDRSIRAVVLRSTGTDFCTGIVDGFVPASVTPDPVSVWSRLRPPVVAAISGACLNVGFEMMLATDIVIAAPTSSYALDHLATDQLPCWGGTQRLCRAIRPAEATAMTLLSTQINADRAHQLGLVHAVIGDSNHLLDGLTVSAETVDEAALALALRLAERGPLALELAKEAVHRGAEMPLRAGLRLEGDLNHQLAATDDRAEGLQAFFDKRPPDFAGR